MRLKVIQYLYFLFTFLVILRLGYWQIIRADDLLSLGEKQRLTTKEVLAPRGSILFSDGSTLASTEPVYSLFAQPKIINDPLKFSKSLAEQILSTEDLDTTQMTVDEFKEIHAKQEREILEKISQDLFWVSLGKKINLETKLRLEKLNLVGLGFNDSSARFYPEGSSSAHLLGFVGSDIYGSQAGYFGLEGYYNGELKGKGGILRQERDALGLPILIGDFLEREPKIGKTLILNVDRTIQHIVEEKLKKGLEKNKAKGVSALVLDPKTGAILAMAGFPSYDPADPSKHAKEVFKNPLIADGYEPGSTFKVLVMAAAINEDVVNPDTKCSICKGPINLGGFTIRTWNNKYYPDTTMEEAIIHSDNTGMVFAAKKLGFEKLFAYIQMFGFGSLTNIDLQDEYNPELRNKKDWREIDLATASFGQGIAVTGIQMVKAVGAIANEGKLMEPQVVKTIIENSSLVNEKKIDINSREIGQPISKETAKVVTEMMVKAVDEGEAQIFKKRQGLLGYKIAGKTGTAQIPVEGHYDPEKTIASFVGFAPADDPKFVMLIRYLEPSSSIFGSETAAPTFFEIAKELFLYYGIAPTGQ